MDSKNLIKKSDEIKEEQFKIFEPLVDQLRKDSKLAMFTSFIILIRRITLLYMAMFIIQMQWLQVLVFMTQNMISMYFLVLVLPYE